MKKISGLALGLHPFFLNLKTGWALTMLGLYIGQTLVLSEHEDKVQNRYKEQHTSQTLKGAGALNEKLLETSYNELEIYQD